MNRRDHGVRRDPPLLLVRPLIEGDLDERTAGLLPPISMDIDRKTFDAVRTLATSGGYRRAGILERDLVKGHRPSTLVPRGRARMAHSIRAILAKRRGVYPTDFAGHGIPDVRYDVLRGVDGKRRVRPAEALSACMAGEPMDASTASRIAMLHAAVASALMTGHGTAHIRAATPWSRAGMIESPLDSTGFMSHIDPFSTYEEREIPPEMHDLLPEVVNLVPCGKGLYHSLHLDCFEMWISPEQRATPMETMRALATAAGHEP